MKTIFQFLLPLLLLADAVADTRPILLVTPKGVYQAEVVDGVPGPWRACDIDVIVQGFSVGSPPSEPTPTDTPTPTPLDPTVTAVAALSKVILKDKSEGQALAALIEALQKANVTSLNFKESLEMGIAIADSSMKADGRFVKWRTEALQITEDPAKLKAGLQEAFAIATLSLDKITASAFDAGYVPTEETADLTQIIQLIQLILDLLKNLGII